MDRLRFLFEKLCEMPYIEAGNVMGLSKMICKLKEVNDTETYTHLCKLEKAFHRGLSLSECEGLFIQYKDDGLFKQFEHNNVMINLNEIRNQFQWLYFEALYLLLQNQKIKEYGIGESGDVSYKQPETPK